MSHILVTALVGLVSAFVGGGVWSFLSTWLRARFDHDEKEIDRLRKDVAALDERHRECEAKFDALERKFDAAEHHHSSLIPRWIKNAHKRVLWVNGAAMVNIFGQLDLNRDQVEGRTLAELLGAEAAREMDRIDRSALANPGRPVSTLLQLHQRLAPTHIVEIAGIGRESELIYEVYAYFPNAPEDEADRGGRRQAEQIGLSSLRIEADEHVQPPD
ncbi:MAG TPA: hypothetical protein VFW19_10560 [Allosphingosinicella sp.]|nr:hypothetical protein [Allosphingosinicella sp.]